MRPRSSKVTTMSAVLTSSPRPRCKRTWLTIVEILSVGLGTFLVLLQGFDDLTRVPFHEDESQWIATSCYLEAMIDPHFQSPEWLRQSMLFDDSTLPSWVRESLSGTWSPDNPWRPIYWVLTQPPMARYLIGVGRLLGGYTSSELNVPFYSGHPLQINHQVGAVPSAGLLRWARLSVLVQSTLSMMLLFHLVRRCHSGLAAYIFLTIALTSPLMLSSMRRSMGEGAVLLFACAGMVAGLRLLDRWKSGSTQLRNQWSSFFWMVVLGVCAGCAGASKLNGLLLSFLGVLLGIAIAIRGAGLQTHRHRLFCPIFVGLVVMITAWASFIAINPFLYTHPVGRLLAMIYLRKREMFDGGGEFFERASETLSLSLVKYNELISNELIAHNYWLSICFLIVGLGSCGKNALGWLRDQQRDAAGLVILCSALLLAIPSFLSGWRFRRYLLFANVFSDIGLALGIAATILCICKYVKSRTRKFG